MSPSATESADQSANGPSSRAKLSWDTFSNTIDGKPDHGTSSRHGINPATEENSSTVPVASKEDVDRAMKAAQKAFKPWAAVPYAERQKAVRAFADAVEAEKDGFAKLLTREQGKPIAFARMEIDAAVSWLRAAAGHDQLAEERLEDDEKTILVRYTPLGVAVGIVPWNFPIQLACGKIGMSLVTGNPMIVKPSPFTPAGGLKLVELGQRFFPPGVLQALSGDDSLGIWLTEHPTPAKISFTGSTETGKKVMASASKTLKRVTLELGGKDPAIILDDVNIEEVAAKIATYAFLNSGQICIAIKRIYVHEKIIDDFRDAMVRYTKTLKLGEGNEEGVFLGPIQNKMQYERVQGFFRDAKVEKQNFAVGGDNPGGKGYFITPTIVDRPSETSRLVVEEPFGPIVPLLSFRTDDEAVAKANDTFFGLGGSIWSSDVERANRLALRIEAGTVWVNTHTDLDPRVPFGGHKHSGMGAENGTAGLKSYCNSQTLFLRKK